MTRSIEQIRDAAARLHSAAYEGNKHLKNHPHRDEVRARFSIPRQPADDDEIVYAAIEELKALREALATPHSEYPYMRDDAATVGEALGVSSPSNGDK